MVSERDITGAIATRRSLERKTGSVRNLFGGGRNSLPLREFARFGASTLLSASMTVGLPILFHEIFHLRSPYAILLAFLIAFAVNFLMMRFFVFAKDGGASQDLVRYTISNLAFRLIEYLVILFTTLYLNIFYAISVIMTLIVSTLIKFCVYKFFVFKPGAIASTGTTRLRPSPTKIVMFAAASLLCMTALLLPAIVNGHAILFPDSVGYYGSGEALLSALSELAVGHKPAIFTGDRIYAARSLYYGFPVAVLIDLFGEWSVPIAQSMLAMIVILIGLRRLDTPVLWSCVFTLTIASITGISFFTSAVMPDVFAGFMILGAAILIGQWPDLAVGERSFWLAIATFGMLVHKGHILVLAAAVLVMGMVLFARNRRAIAPFAALCAAIILAVLAHQSITVATRLATGQPPRTYPFMLARVVGDGTAKSYLDAECSRNGYFLCRYRDRLTMTENDFLWSLNPQVGLYRFLSPKQKLVGDGEAREIVLGAVTTQPYRQIERTLYLMARMNINVGVTRYGLSPALSAETGAESLVSSYAGSPITDGRIPLEEISRWMRAVYLLAYVALLGLVWKAPVLMMALDGKAVTRQAILAGVIANACVFGAISSSADRYQGRVAWLVALVALATLRSFVIRCSNDRLQRSATPSCNTVS